MTLREGRADLHQRLTNAADTTQQWGPLYWQKAKLVDLLDEAAIFILKCPHVECAYCWQVERKEQG